MRGMLHLNSSQPLPAGLIATSLSLPGDASGQAVVRDAARHLNLSGVPVVSGESGFWIATTAGEVRVYIESLMARNRAVWIRIEALKRIADDMERGRKPGQQLLFDQPDGPAWRSLDDDED